MQVEQIYTLAYLFEAEVYRGDGHERISHSMSFIAMISASKKKNTGLLENNSEGLYSHRRWRG